MKEPKIILSQPMAEPVDHALLLLDQLRGREDCPEIESIRRDVLKMYRSLRRFAEADAIHNRKMRAEPELISAGGILYQICRDSQYAAVLRGIKMTYYYDECVFCLADEDMLRRILWNLVQNALQAVGDGGIIHMKAEIQGPNCHFTIEDNGPGFGDRDPQILFEKAPETTGFGVVREFLRLHNSTLRFSRENDKTQVCFDIFFPKVPNELNCPMPALRLVRALSDAEVELSPLEWL